MDVRTRFVVLLTLAGCPSQRAQPVALHHNGGSPAEPVELAPFIHAAPVPTKGCELDWDELMTIAEPRIELTTTPSDECAVSDLEEPPQFATLRGGVPAR